MSKSQFAILRFAKYKGPEISNIEAHNERTKEKYASNPDVDTSRSHLNFHLITPEQKYRAEAERQIKDAGCRTRSDSVRVVEALVTATPEFFKGKKKDEIKAYFQEALDFIKQNQNPETIISAVVHMDEKTPHMHLCFVPLTEDGRLSAKDIMGNKKKLTWWQDEFWKHMVKKFPDLERGESASLTVLPPAKGDAQGYTPFSVAKETRGMAISALSEHQDLAFQVLDFMCSPEGRFVEILGTEGNNYEVGEDGKITITNTWYVPMFNTLNNFDESVLSKPYYSDVAQSSLDMVNEYMSLDNDFAISSDLTVSWDAAQNVVSEFYADYIIGNKTDADWDAFVASFYEMGGQAVTDYANSVLK